MGTRALAAFAATLRYEDLPDTAITAAKRLLLDGLGCLVAGTRSEPGQAAARVARTLGGQPQATVLAGGWQTSVRDAAFVNGICLYSVGVNDIHKPSMTHPGACIIPVVLALGEWLDAPGSHLIAAMVAGYEVCARVGRAVAPSHREQGFHPTGTCGTFGAAAAAGRVLGLPPDVLTCALGIAGSQAAGLYEFHADGSLTMIFHAGRAAQNGVEAALLAREGLTGPATVLEGKEGFGRATADRFDGEALLTGLGQSLAVEATSHRPWWGCSSTIAASAAVERIVQRLQGGAGGTAGLSQEAVQAVAVRCHPQVVRDNADANPRTLLAARLSMPFNVALVLCRGSVLWGDLEPLELWREDVRALLPRVRLEADPAMPRFGARVTIYLASGHQEEEEVLHPKGDPDNPFTYADICAKFHRLAGPVMGEAGCKAVAEAVAGLEGTSGRHLASLLREACQEGRQP